MPCGQFPANRLNEPKSQSDIASRPLPKAPASSSQYDVVPQMIIRSSNVRPREFAIGDAKSLLQQYLPRADIDSYSTISSARLSSVGGMVMPSNLAVFAFITSSNLVGCSRQVGGLGTFENFVDVSRGSALDFRAVCRIRHQPSRVRHLPVT